MQSRLRIRTPLFQTKFRKSSSKKFLPNIWMSLLQLVTNQHTTPCADANIQSKLRSLQFKPIQARTRDLSTGENVQKWTRYFLLFFRTRPSDNYG